MQAVFSGPELCRRQAHEVVALLKSGEISPRDCLDAAFARIAEVEPAINAMPTICPERAYDAAMALMSSDSGEGPWLAGLPLAIKDLNMVCGVRTTFGPMSGFRNAVIDELFYAGTSWRSNFLLNLGYGDGEKLHPRAARLDFDEACRIV